MVLVATWDVPIIKQVHCDKDVAIEKAICRSIDMSLLRKRLRGKKITSASHLNICSDLRQA